MGFSAWASNGAASDRCHTGRMELYLLRHGIAEDASPGIRDEDRKLTDEGREKVRNTLRLAARIGVKPALILTSPFVRAVETAEVAAKALGYEGDLVRTNVLVPDAQPRNVWSEIRTLRDEDQLLLASHNPLCASLAGYLLGAPELSVAFRKGALLRVDFASFGHEPRGVLQWLMTPKMAAD
jgi:phosphohistidine phosphatase